MQQKKSRYVTQNLAQTTGHWAVPLHASTFSLDGLGWFCKTDLFPQPVKCYSKPTEISNPITLAVGLVQK